MAKRLFKVTILFCIIVGLFVIPSFAVSANGETFYNQPIPVIDSVSYQNIIDANFVYGERLSYYNYLASSLIDDVYIFDKNYTSDYVIVSPYEFTVSPVFFTQTGWNRYTRGNIFDNVVYDSTYDLYYIIVNNYEIGTDTFLIPVYNSVQGGLSELREYLDNNTQPSYDKNPNVDEFIANTMISMGVKFETPAYALSYASDAWVWCIDDTNMETANPFDEWNIESFVSYCNAQSNNYLNWYNGYKVSKDVTNALGEYIRQNIRLLSGLPAGITSLTSAYMPIYHYGSGFQSGVSSPTAQTFYPAQTITYFNGEYVSETDDISTSQFLYTPADVRRFLGYPGSSPVITPSSPTGTGTITDDPNNPDQKNITINFPALDWLADAIKSILDFLRDAFTTLANLLTQLLDAILGLFSDAFESLSDFGQGIIDWLYAIVAGFSTIGGNYIPASLWAVILPFILINIGVGLIMFVLRSH